MSRQTITIPVGQYDIKKYLKMVRQHKRFWNDPKLYGPYIESGFKRG